jgi:hypothetical protein
MLAREIQLTLHLRSDKVCTNLADPTAPFFLQSLRALTLQSALLYANGPRGRKDTPMKTSGLPFTVYLISPLLLLAFGCKKTESTPAPASSSQPAPVAAASAPAAPPAAALEAAAPSVPVTLNGITLSSTTGSGKSVDWALKQNEIKNDPAGQWAVSAMASSSWEDAKDQERYAPWQATGAPNVDEESDSPASWTPKTASAGIEWLELTFPRAVSATGLRIRESDSAGAIIKVELIDTGNQSHALWSGTDPTRGLNYLMLSFPKTTYKANRVKITLATNLGPGYKEIDAVQLLGGDK